MLSFVDSYLKHYSVVRSKEKILNVVTFLIICNQHTVPLFKQLDTLHKKNCDSTNFFIIFTFYYFHIENDHTYITNPDK